MKKIKRFINKKLKKFFCFKGKSTLVKCNKLLTEKKKS